MTRPKIAVVTGGNRGIGFEICRQLAGLGMQVVVGSRDAAKGEAAVAQLASAGLNGVSSHAVDVTSESSVDAFVAWVDEQYGACDVLVNNAGVIDTRSGRVLTTSLATLQEVLATNLAGPFLMVKGLVPLMQRENYGRIVNLSSGLGQLAEMGAGTPAYRISKTALNALTRTLSAELTGTNILVNAMCPGWVRTDMGGPHALRSVEQGAETAIWLATLPDGGPSGRFFRDCKVIAW
ncbi:MAG TPA: SDR family oxidoreductase [Burkholderiales bacterium]|nr:SDR family oxidoreductase [Betaproteobacteria bacterium]HQR52067.1 SDR family oxidoreductase [Burkholderiales bacterium]